MQLHGSGGKLVVHGPKYVPPFNKGNPKSRRVSSWTLTASTVRRPSCHRVGDREGVSEIPTPLEAKWDRSSGLWSCTTCSLTSGALNEACEMCEWQRHPGGRSLPLADGNDLIHLVHTPSGASSSGPWTCGACSFINDVVGGACELCGVVRLTQ